MHLFNAEGSAIEKAFVSLAKGLYRLGDFFGRISGFRDLQEGSVMLKNYHRNQAIEETKGIYYLGKFVLKNPPMAMKAFSIYIESNEEQVKANSIVNFYVGLAVPTIGITSFVGNLIHGANEINKIYNEL